MQIPLSKNGAVGTVSSADCQFCLRWRVNTLVDYPQQYFLEHKRQLTLSLQKVIERTRWQYFQYGHVSLGPSVFQFPLDTARQDAAWPERITELRKAGFSYSHYNSLSTIWRKQNNGTMSCKFTMLDGRSIYLFRGLSQKAVQAQKICFILIWINSVPQLLTKYKS